MLKHAECAVIFDRQRLGLITKKTIVEDSPFPLFTTEDTNDHVHKHIRTLGLLPYFSSTIVNLITLLSLFHPRLLPVIVYPGTLSFVRWLCFSYTYNFKLNPYIFVCTL